MKPDTMNNDPAFPVMAMDILSNVLSRADDPGDLGTYLTEEIRDLTGAHCVLLIQCLCTATLTAHRVVSVNPLRSREWAESPAVNRLYDDVVHLMPAAQFWRGDEPSEVAGLLRQEGFELSIVFPLNAGAFRVGAMLVLGLPDEKHISSVLSLLNALSAIVALVLRNSFLFERQEQIIQERTAELRASEEKYRTLIESANDAVFIHEIREDGMPGPFIEVNEPACRRLGYSREELARMSPMELDDPRYRDRLALAMERLLKEGHAVFETAQMAKDGRSIPVEVSTRVLEMKGKRLLFSIVRDITERKRAEDALKESEAKYMDLYENAPDMYASVNARTALIEQCNNTLSSTLGYSKEEIIGRPVFEIYHPDCLEEVQNTFKLFLDKGEVRDKELHLRKKDGSRLDVSLNVSSVHDKDGGILYSRSTLRDITESKRSHAINASRLHLMQFAATHSLDELLEETLNEAEKLTGSVIGFYHFVDDDQRSLTLQNWSTRTKAEFCKAEGKGLHYPIAEAGVWVDCVYQRTAVIHNDYASLPHRKGMPEGHAAVIRELVVPVSRGDKIKAILGVGNKPSDYIEKDVETISLLADLAWEIAERKRAQDALAKSEARFRRLAENARDAIYRMALPDGAYEYMSPAATELFGYAPEEFYASSQLVRKIIHPEWRGYFEEEWRKLLQGEMPPTYEYQIIHKSGDARWMNQRNILIRDDEGRIVAIEGIVTDITERKKAEEQIQHLKNYLSNIIDSMPSIVVGMNRDETVTQWNRQAEEISGISATEAVGRPITDLLPDFSPWIAGMRGEMDRQRPASMEKLLIEKGGKRRFYDLMLYPLIGNGVEGAVVRIEDVTERARIQELMIQTEKMISVGGLAAGMAHEINNPLGIITQAAQNIERRVSPELPANRKAAEELGVSLEGIKAYFERRQIPEFIGSIREASLRASRIIANMLQFSRCAGTTMQPASLAGIMDQALELAASDYDLKKKYDFRSIEIIRDYAPDMPEVPMVPVEIEQVMLNLLKNAAQAMMLTPADRKPAIILRLRREERYALLEVEDNGPGMKEEVRRRVFEPFFTTKEPGMGTGLGLSVSYMIVTQNHKGLMEVESKPGKGACFRVRLPLKNEAART
jgi:PAS domain S-box-containing protein